jgi:hypothetical protein
LELNTALLVIGNDFLILFAEGNLQLHSKESFLHRVATLFTTSFAAKDNVRLRCIKGFASIRLGDGLPSPCCHPCPHRYNKQ